MDLENLEWDGRSNSFNLVIIFVDPCTTWRPLPIEYFLWDFHFLCADLSTRRV